MAKKIPTTTQLFRDIATAADRFPLPHMEELNGAYGPVHLDNTERLIPAFWALYDQELAQRIEAGYHIDTTVTLRDLIRDRKMINTHPTVYRWTKAIARAQQEDRFR